MIMYLAMTDSSADQSKFEMIYSKYKNLMYYIANRYLENEYDAEDAVQQAFISILKNMNKIEDVGSSQTKSYIITIVERKAIDILRKRKKQEETRLNEEISFNEIDEPIDLEWAISKLSSNYRNVLTLKYVHEMSTRDISNMLGITPSGVSKLLFRAKTELRRILEENDITI